MRKLRFEAKAELSPLLAWKSVIQINMRGKLYLQCRHIGGLDMGRKGSSLFSICFFFFLSKILDKVKGGRAQVHETGGERKNKQ